MARIKIVKNRLLPITIRAYKGGTSIVNTKILKGDCFQLIKNIQDDSIDLILIDPPYIISKGSGFVNNSPEKTKYISKYGKHKIDFGEWDKNEICLQNLLSEFYRILKPSGTLIMFYDFWKMQELKECAESLKFKQSRLGIWNKTNPVPINSKLNYLSNSREFFVTFVKKSKPTFNSVYDDGNYYITEENDTYFLPILHGKERTSHPTQKPLLLIENLIKKHSNTGDIVLDCFMGSGTTGAACVNTNRNFIGIEIDQEYFNIAKERIEKSKDGSDNH